MIAPRIPWRSPWPRLLPLLLLLMMPAAGQYLGWLMASPLGESVSLLPGWASWAVILATAAVLTRWSGLLTSPSLRVETGAQMPGASLAFGAATLHAMSAQGSSKDFAGVAGFAYGLACLWLCANAFGSEFDHRTMGQLLVQPRSRGRIYREKLGVAGSLAGLAAVIVFLTTSRSTAGDPQILGETLGYLILGLASAPFFTLISRSTLAGFVFTWTVPMALYLMLQTLLDVYHARVHPDLLHRSSEELWLLWVGGILYLATTAFAGWRVFRRMEWREGGTGGASAPGLHALTGAWGRWLGRRWTVQNATVQLIRKELRLHVVPWLVAGILVGLWGLSLLIRKWAPESEWGVAAANPSTVTLFAGIVGAFIFLVTGASAIAEERVLGTLEWQWTQPIPMARQWKIKVGVATGLALTLGLVLPAALVWLGFSTESLNSAWGEPEWQPIAVSAMALGILFAVSLYASSVSQSSMKAVALTPLLLASLWAVGTLTAWSVVTVIDQYWGNLWLWRDLDRWSDPALLNQMPPAWLLTGPILRWITQFGAILIGGIWVGFLVRNARLNAQRLRSTGSAVWRQWGRLSGALLLALLLGGLLLIGLSRERGYYDQLSMLKNQRERFIQYAAKAEREGNFTREYLLPLGITDRPSPEELVDTLLRQRGFRWMSHDFVEHFQRDSLVAAKPRFFKARREELIQFATKAEQEGKFTPEYLSPLGITNRPSPKELVDFLIRQRGFGWLRQDFNRHFQRKPTIGTDPRIQMHPEFARRSGLQTQPGTMTPPGSAMPSTNPASPESATSAPMPMMSQELMKRYGLLPKGPSRTSATTTPKASTNPPANPTPGQ